MRSSLRVWCATACAVGAISTLWAGSAAADSVTAPVEYVSAAKAAVAGCDQEVVDATLVVTQVRAESEFNTRVVSAAGAEGPAQLLPSEFAVYGADDDGNGVASPFDVTDAVTALTRLDCSLARELAAQGHVVDPVSVIAAVVGGIGQVDNAMAQDIAARIWAEKIVVE